MTAFATATATPPNYKTGLINKVFFIRWEQPPSAQDLFVVDKRFREAYEAYRQQLSVVVITGAKARVPNGEQRKGLDHVQARYEAVASFVGQSAGRQPGVLGAWGARVHKTGEQRELGARQHVQDHDRGQ